MSTVLPYLLSGISVGGQYALIAIGYTMVYGILRLINFAHGDVFMVAGILMVYISASGPAAVSCRIPLVLVLTALIGFVIERVAYKPLRSAPRMSIMISAIGVSYTLQNLVLYITGGLQSVLSQHPLHLRVRDHRHGHHQDGDHRHPGADAGAGDRAGACSSTTPRSAWPCGPCPRILRPASSWASRSTA